MNVFVLFQPEQLAEPGIARELVAIASRVDVAADEARTAGSRRQ